MYAPHLTFQDSQILPAENILLSKYLEYNELAGAERLGGLYFRSVPVKSTINNPQAVNSSAIQKVRPRLPIVVDS